jgi:UDP-sugar diphosphatase
MLKPVTIKKIEDCPNPRFSKVQLVTADRDGEEFKWEMSPGADTVHILVFNTTRHKFLYVRQVRVPVLVNDPETLGRVVECCAGLIDKDKNIGQIAIEEVLEELGYAVKRENLLFFKAIKSSVGKAGIKAHLFLATVTDDDRVSDGGGIHGEDIEVVEVDPNEVTSFLLNETTDAVTMALTFMIIHYLDWRCDQDDIENSNSEDSDKS